MEEKRVRDLMLALDEYATIGADKSIRESLSRSQLGLNQDRHHHRAVLVLDKNNKVLGKLTHWAVIRALEPKFLKTDDLVSLSRAGLTEKFIATMEDGFSMFTGSLEQMCRYAAHLRAKDAMVPAGENIDADAPLTEAIRILALTHVQSLPVTSEGQVVGILRLSDVFRAVADIIIRSDVG